MRPQATDTPEFLSAGPCHGRVGRDEAAAAGRLPVCVCVRERERESERERERERCVCVCLRVCVCAGSCLFKSLYFIRASQQVAQSWVLEARQRFS